MEEQNQSPTSPLPKSEPKLEQPVKNMTFPEAMKAVISGKSVTRLEWESNEDYGLFTEGYLKIYTKGKLHQWIISEGDLLGDDWVVLPTVN